MSEGAGQGQGASEGAADSSLAEGQAGAGEGAVDAGLGLDGASDGRGTAGQEGAGQGDSAGAESDRGIAPIPRDPATGRFLPQSAREIPPAEGIELPGVSENRPGESVWDAPPGEAPEPPAAAEADAPVEGEGGGEGEDDSAQEFEFAGEKWPSREKAEDNFKTLRGMHKSMERRVQDFGDRAQLNLQRAQEWSEFANREIPQRDQRIAQLEGELTRRGIPVPGGANAQPTAGQPGTSAQPSSSTEGEFDPVRAVDWDLVDNLRETRGDRFANAYIADVMNKGYEARLASQVAALRAEMDSKLAPYQQDTANLQAMQAAIDLVNTTATYTYDDGTPVYPELSIPDEAQRRAILTEIGNLAEEFLGFDQERLLTPRGLHAAIIQWRDYKRARGEEIPGHQRPAPASSPAQPPESPQSVSPERRAAAAAALSTTPRPVAPHQELSLAESIQREFGTEQDANEADLGFSYVPRGLV